MSRRVKQVDRSPCKSQQQGRYSRGAMGALERIVDDCIAHRGEGTKLRGFYASGSPLEDAIERAALAKLPDGKRHWHQRRIPKKVLQKSRDRLLAIAPDIERCQSFHELFLLVRSHIQPIWGIGELTVYDTADRIGLYLGLEPEMVYLHAGTRVGMDILGIPHDGIAVRMEDLPPVLHRLSPSEVEDCLCIYKRRLRPLEAWSRHSEP